MDSLIDFLFNVFSRISEPAEGLETDHHDHLIFEKKKYKNLIALAEFGVKNGFEIYLNHLVTMTRS